MHKQRPALEGPVVRGSHPYPEAPGRAAYAPHPRRGRIGIFLGVFLLIVGVGALYQWLRPVEFSSEAVVRISAGSLQDASQLVQGYSVEDLEGLVSRGLFEKVYRDLVDRGILDAGADAPRVDDLQAMVDASPAGGDMVRLYARGTDAVLLHEMLRSWIDVYRAGRQSSGEVRNESAYREALKRDAVLTEKLTAKRAQMEAFRRDNDIVSLERGENQVLAELKQLTGGLAKAKERESDAESRMQSARESLELGIPFLLKEDKAALDALKVEADLQREQLAGFAKKYTSTYMKLNPATRKLQERLAKLEQSVSERTEEAQRNALEEVRRGLLDARAARANLERRLADQKLKAAVFATRHSEYQALTKDLDQLETLSREVRERLVSLDVNDGGLETRVELVEPPYLPERPGGSFHWLELAKLAVVAAFLAFLVLRLVEYLNRDEAPARESQVQIFQHMGEAQLSGPAMAVPGVSPSLANEAGERLLRDSDLRLTKSDDEARELSAREVLALLQASADEGRLVIGLLICGVQVAEISVLRWTDVDLAAGTIEIAEGARRRIHATPTLIEDLGTLATYVASPRQRLLTHADGHPFGEADIDGLVAVAAHDAGLRSADDIRPESLRHTYLSFLVRQGARLGELSALAGPIPPSRMRAYTRLSPPGPGRSLDQIETIYPLG